MYLIADRLTATGFKLGGLRNVRIADKETVIGLLEEASSKAQIILITNSLASHAKKEIERLRKAGKIVVEVPDKSDLGEDFVSKMIKDVIGIELKK